MAKSVHIWPMSAVLAAAVLSGCVSSIPPVQVTRFHLEQTIAPASFRVETAGEATSEIESGVYAAAVTRRLTALGFMSSGEAAAYIVSLTGTRETRDSPSTGSPVTIGIGGGTGGFGGSVGGGIGIGTSFGIGGNRGRSFVFTALKVRIRRASDQAVIWEGRAETSSKATAPAAQPGLAADKLATALFNGFPGVSGETITVP